MVTTLGNNIINAYTGGVQVKEIYSFGVKVWPVSTPGPANNEIWYTTNTSQICTPMYNRFGAQLLTNTYSDGKGVMTFNGNVTQVGNMVFENCSELLTMTLPESVTTIGDYAFENCENLYTINIPSGVTSIGYNAFNIAASASHSGRLRSITIPSGVTRIESMTFHNQGTISSITIPSGVTYIGSQAFESCANLETVIMEPSVPPTLLVNAGGYNQFLNCSPNLQIKVPSQSLNAYLTATGWSDYASQIVAMPDDSIDFSTLGLENTQVVDVNTYGTFSSGDMEVQFTTVNSSTSKYYAMGTAVRMYGGNSVTISSSTKTISQIEFTWTGTSSTSYEPSSDVATPSGYDYQTYIWTGSASQVTLTRPTGSGHWRLKSILVTYQ